MIEVKPLVKDQYEEWYPLWQGYLTFYESSLPDDVTKETWSRFFDDNEPMYALGAFMDGKLVGIVHYLYHRTCWSKDYNCYLQDLFADPDIRGKGIGRALIEAVHDRAKEANANTVYWMTQEDNKTARLLYDRIAEKTGFIHYEKSL